LHELTIKGITESKGTHETEEEGLQGKKATVKAVLFWLLMILVAILAEIFKALPDE
jgi:hypothetical protein